MALCLMYLYLLILKLAKIADLQAQNELVDLLFFFRLIYT